MAALVDIGVGLILIASAGFIGLVAVKLFQNITKKDDSK